MAYSDHAFKARFPIEQWKLLKAYAMLSGMSLNELVNVAVHRFLEAEAADPAVRARMNENLRKLQDAAEGFLVSGR